MYSVIIADDEELIRRGLKNFIPWEELGFRVVAEFEDGLPLIEYLKEHPVDLIFSDIRMIHSGGLDVARYVYENVPNTIVCLISGYKDFEYAKKAMKYNVAHYIIKPTDIEEITEIVKELKTKIEEHKQLREQSANYPELLEIAERQFLTDIFTGRFKNREALNEHAKTLHIENSQAFYCPFWITSPDYPAYIQNKWRYGKERFFTAICNFVYNNNQTFKIQNIIMSGEEFLFVAISPKADSAATFQKQLEEYLAVVRNNIKQMLDLNVEYQVNRVFQNLSSFVDYLFYPVQADTNTQHTAKNSPSVREDSADMIISRAKEYIQANYTKDISLEDVASHVFLNSAYFSRFFKKHTNKTFSEYLIHMKIEKAIQLIQENKYKIYEISDMLGYKNSKYFAYQFKQTTGVAPTEYIENLKSGGLDEK